MNRPSFGSSPPWARRSILALALVGLGGLGARLAVGASKRAARSSEAGGSTPPPGPGSEIPVDGAAAPTTSVQLGMGMPERTSPCETAPCDYLMVKPQYALSYNPSRKVANWLSWRVDAASFGTVRRYDGKFLADSTLPPSWYHVQDYDYNRSGYERRSYGEVRGEVRDGRGQ